jgi:hypothetical protein
MHTETTTPTRAVAAQGALPTKGHKRAKNWRRWWVVQVRDEQSEDELKTDIQTPLELQPHEV